MPVYTCSMVAREGLRRHDDDAEKHREGGGGGDEKTGSRERGEESGLCDTRVCVCVTAAGKDSVVGGGSSSCIRMQCREATND